MTKWISRASVLRIIDADPVYSDVINEKTYMASQINNLPTKEEKPRPHGEWVENTRYKRKGKKFLDCSRCHYGENGDIICEVSKLPNFCPNCGADMRKREGEKNESDHL